MSEQPASTDRKKILVGIAASWIAAAVFISSAFIVLIETRLLFRYGPPELLVFSLALAAAPLAAGIGWAARTRFFDQDIDGRAPTPGSPLELTQRFIQNTSEQTTLFTLALLSFWFATPKFLILLPIFAVWFCIARLAFWIGYRRNNPVHRAFGFAGTFHPTIVILLFSVFASAGWIASLSAP